MIFNPYPGKFCLLAGCDGSGKDTQAKRLERTIPSFHPAIKLMTPFPKEPTKGPIGVRIYDILFGRDPEFQLGVNLTDFDFQKFYIRDRIEHYRNVIIPALSSGVNVICNRGIDGTLVYGANTLSDFQRMMIIHEEMFAEADVPLIWPDLIVIYDITPETALRRMEKSHRERDAFEQESKIRRVTSNYRAFAALYPHCHLVDAEPDGEEGQKDIFKSARAHVYPLLGISLDAPEQAT